MTDKDMAVDQETNLDEPQDKEELSEEEQLLAKLQEAITVEKEEIGSLRLKLTISIPRETLDDRMGEQFAELKREADVPGFRKGHAPMKLIEKRFSRDVGDQVVSQLIGNGFLAAKEKENLDTLGNPLIWTKVKEPRVVEGVEKTVETEKLLSIEEASEHIKLPSEGQLVFSCETDLKPQFTLPKLDSIPLEKPAITITDEHVDTELDRMRSMQGKFEPVTDGAVEADDLLFADVKVVVGDQELFSEENFDLPARDTRIKGLTVKGFGEAVVGKNIGEGAVVEITVPDDHENVSLRGKTGSFSATVREIKRFHKAPLDEALLSQAGYESEKELRSAIRGALEEKLDSMVKQANYGEIKEYLVENTELEVPQSLSENLTEQTLSRRKVELLREGLPQEEVDKKIDELRTETQEQAAKQVKLMFILADVADKLDITINEEELNGAIASIAASQNRRFDRVRDELASSGNISSLVMELRDDKVLSALWKQAEFTEAKKKSPAKKSPKKKKSAKKSTKKSEKKE